MSLSDLPLEVLHFITTFLAKDDYRAILKFRTICRYWKEIGDHSLVWLECQLYIYPPTTYLTLIHAWRVRSVTFAINVNLHEEITVIRKIVGQVLVVPEEVEEQRSPILLLTSSLSEENRFERAKYISSHFLKKFRFYHHAWDRFVFLYHWLNCIRVYNRVWLDSSIFEISCFVNLFILGIGTFLVSSIVNYPTSLSLREVLGFCCIYWNLGFYFINWIFYFLSCFARDLTGDDEINILRPLSIFFKPTYVDELIVLIYLAAIIETFILFQCTLSSENGSVKYSYIVLPFFCSTIVSVITLLRSGGYDRIVESIGLVGLSSIFVTILVVGLYYDESSYAGISSLGYAFIPLIPIELVILGASIVCILRTLSLWSDFLQGETIVPAPIPQDRGNICHVFKVFLRLLANLAVTISACFIFLLLLEITYGAFEETLSLAGALVSVLLIILFVQIGFLGRKYERISLR